MLQMDSPRDGGRAFEGFFGNKQLEEATRLQQVPSPVFADSQFPWLMPREGRLSIAGEGNRRRGGEGGGGI